MPRQVSWPQPLRFLPPVPHHRLHCPPRQNPSRQSAFASSTHYNQYRRPSHSQKQSASVNVTVIVIVIGSGFDSPLLHHPNRGRASAVHALLLQRPSQQPWRQQRPASQRPRLLAAAHPLSCATVRGPLQSPPPRYWIPWQSHVSKSVLTKPADVWAPAPLSSSYPASCQRHYRSVSQ